MMQNQSKCNEHIFNTQLGDLDFWTDVEDLLLDIKVLLKEYYMGTFTDDGKALLLNFTNGQKFKLIIEEIK